MATAVFRDKKIELTLDKAEVFDYLLSLRDSGVTNMWGSSPYIVSHFDCTDDEASYWLIAWIESFK